MQELDVDMEMDAKMESITSTKDSLFGNSPYVEEEERSRPEDDFGQQHAKREVFDSEIFTDEAEISHDAEALNTSSSPFSMNAIDNADIQGFNLESPWEGLGGSKDNDESADDHWNDMKSHLQEIESIFYDSDDGNESSA